MFPRASLAFLAAALLALASCETVEADDRRCRSRVFATLVNAERTCGVRQEIDLRMCEDPPAASCPTQEPSYLCLASPGDTGFLIELSPCYTLNSLPDGWALAELYTNGVSALPECKIARDRCDGSTVPFVASDEKLASVPSRALGPCASLRGTRNFSVQIFRAGKEHRDVAAIS